MKIRSILLLFPAASAVTATSDVLFPPYDPLNDSYVVVGNQLQDFINGIDSSLKILEEKIKGRAIETLEHETFESWIPYLISYHEKGKDIDNNYARPLVATYVKKINLPKPHPIPSEYAEPYNEPMEEEEYLPA